MHSLFIVTTAVAGWFNFQADAMGNNGLAIGDICLSATGTTPGTHGWCAVSLSAAQETAVTDLLAANPDKASGINWTRYDQGTDPSWPQKQLVVRGLKLIQGKFP